MSNDLSYFKGMSSPKTALSLQSIAEKLTYFQEELQLIHWNTQSFAEHKATGGLYEYIQGFKDEIVEKVMGYTNSRPGMVKTLPLTQTTSSQVVDSLMEFACDLKEYGEMNRFHDVCNLADSLSGEAAKTKYLLTLT